jgi:hypothetical protein
MKKVKDLFDMTKEEAEKYLGQATKAEIARHHAAGRPTGHADEKGVYRLYPDGHKEYVKLYSKEQGEKTVLTAAGRER